MRRYKDQLYFIDTQVTKNKEHCRYYDEFKNVAHFSIRYRNAAQRIKLPGKTTDNALYFLLPECR
jgi:predicted ATPase